jgi:hypothetical protein
MFGVTLGTIFSFNMNQLYFHTLQRNVYEPLREDLNHGVDFTRVMGTLRKGVGDAWNEI